MSGQRGARTRCGTRGSCTGGARPAPHRAHADYENKTRKPPRARDAITRITLHGIGTLSAMNCRGARGMNSVRKAPPHHPNRHCIHERAASLCFQPPPPASYPRPPPPQSRREAGRRRPPPRPQMRTRAALFSSTQTLPSLVRLRASRWMLAGCRLPQLPAPRLAKALVVAVATWAPPLVVVPSMFCRCGWR